MSTEIEAPPELTRRQVRNRIAKAAAAREQGMAWAELAEDARRGWYRSLIDQAIGWMAQTRQPFSANDIRELLPPDTPTRGLMGSRFTVASARRGLIRRIGGVGSLLENTHRKPIAVWIGVDHEEPA